MHLHAQPIKKLFQKRWCLTLFPVLVAVIAVVRQRQHVTKGAFPYSAACFWAWKVPGASGLRKSASLPSRSRLWSERQSTPSPKLSCTVLDTTPKSARDDGFFGDCQRKVFARRDHLNVTSSSSDSSIIKTDTTTTIIIPQNHQSQSRMPQYMT
ncbi:hypothetical protein CKAH01_01624 [Colletotrichum kahawae]|uniref:Uncharacterized protein n=1 Tax=Colletotrichum kahawae TaxID=34407 RepID=A0AAD9Y5U9_COLKA|nr:hypothetical protein CKAH01_01624 [Colletotrichum kahawae]